MSPVLTFFLIGFGIIIALGFWSYQATKKQNLQRAAHIKSYHFPAALRGKVALKYPQLTLDQLELVYRGLRQYFLACLDANVVKSGKSVGMPSKVVDDLWHEFILHSRDYASFCDKAFGGFLHHTPDSSMKIPMAQALGNTLDRIKARGNADTSATGVMTLAGIPLLFAIDSALAIEGGFIHNDATISNLEAQRAAMASAAGSGGESGFSFGISSGSGESDGGSCGSGSCGGGGCGGGCS
jgi:hypothetical protein